MTRRTFLEKSGVALFAGLTVVSRQRAGEIQFKVGDWQNLFDGKTLGDWEITEYGGEGEVYVKDKSIYCDMGAQLTGVNWKGRALPKTDYEISVEAMKINGNDFFCGIIWTT